MGWRSTFYRIGSIFCQGGLVILAGYLEKHYNVPLAWSITMGLLAVIMILLSIWHGVALARPVEHIIEKFMYSSVRGSFPVNV